MSDAEFDALLGEHGVNDRGRELINRVRSGPPARAVAGGAGNVCGRYPSRKMGRTIQYESRTVEFAYLMCCETDPAVAVYYDQPVELPLRYVLKNGRFHRVNHIPDFLVVGDEFAGFIECKRLDALPGLAERAPSRYQRVEDDRSSAHVWSSSTAGWRCPPGEEAAALYGLGYRIWTPAGVTPQFVDNARLLQSKWGGSDRTFPAGDVDRVTGAVAEKLGVTLEELVERIGDPDLVQWCVYCRRVHVDLGAAFLSHPDRVRVFEDARCAAAWSAAVASVGDRHSDNADDLARSALARYPPKAVAAALDRYRILLPFIESGAPLREITGPGSAGRQRWLAAYRQAQRDRGLGLIGLCPKIHLRGNRLPRLPEKAYRVLEEVAVEKYDNSSNINMKVAHALAVDRCVELGLPCLTYNAFRLFLQKRDPDETTRARRGRKAAAAAAPAFGTGGREVHGQGPLDVVHVDHTLLDVLVRVGSAADSIPVRPWLTLVMCAWSRCVVGYDLSFDAPAVAGLFTALRDTFDRQGRIPNRLVVDRGPEFESTALAALCAACGIDKMSRPPGRPKHGSVVERMFGTVNTGLVHALRGNTQLLKNPRGMSREVDPRRDAVWRLLELDALVRRFLFDVYPKMPHEGIEGMTPRDRFELGERTLGQARPVLESADLRFLLCPPYRRDTALVNNRTGVRADYLRYWHPDMRSVPRGLRVPVRLDSYDASRAFAFLNDRWVVCSSEYAAEFAGRSRREVWLASKVLRARLRAAGQRRMLRASDFVRYFRDVAETEEGLRRAKQEEERREVLERRGLRSVDASARPVVSGDDPGLPAPTWESLDLDAIPEKVSL